MPLKPFFLMKPPAVLLRRYLLGKDAPDDAVRQLTEAISQVPATTLAERLRVVLAQEERQSPSLPGLPVLLLQARHDALVPWEAQSRLERHFPEARVTWIEAPHLLLARAPDACREAVKAFLDEL
jgi:pimeloyl-ACP methyl ester carboxylesterase